MDKIKTHAFKKDVYLLGVTVHGEHLWLEAATWECDWYWGLGYCETYTNDTNPAKSRDITSHTHFNGVLGKQDNGKYLHHMNEYLSESVLTDAESWELADLMKSAYTLRDAAAVFHRGGSHLTSTLIQDECVNVDVAELINTVELPKLFSRMYEILTPKEAAQ
jgi:hypothetical protein